MAATMLQLGWGWDPEAEDYFLHSVDLDFLIPDSHEHLFRFIDFDLHQIENPLAQYLSCLEKNTEPDKDLLRPVVKALRQLHPYFLYSPVNTAYTLNRVFAGYIRSHFPEADDTQLENMFREVSVKKFKEYADPDLCFQNSIPSGNPYVLSDLFACQKRTRRWLFVTLDDTNADLAALSTHRRSALYSIISPSDEFSPILNIKANFSQRRSKKMAEQISKWDLAFIEELFDEDEDPPKKKSNKKPVDMISKITDCLDGLYFNPTASMPGAVKEAIQLTSDVDDYDVITYEIDNISNIFDLEVYRMIAQGLRVKRCQNCGKYFIPDKPKRECCNRVPEGATKTCEEILRAKKRAKHEEESHESFVAPYDLYRTAYKTRAARVRKGVMTQDAFDRWKKDGLAKKALVEAGELDIREFAKWLKE